MPAILGKLFNLGNRSNSNLSTSATFSYPSNPPLPVSTSTVPALAPGVRDSLPPYPHNELPSIGSWPGNRRNRANTNVGHSENPFSDARRTSTASTLQRSQSYAVFPKLKHQSGSLSHDAKKDAKEEDKISSVQVPLRRRAISTTAARDPSQFLLTRPLKWNTQQAPSSAQTKEPCSRCGNDIKPTSPEGTNNVDKGKGKAVDAPTPTRSRYVKQCKDEDADSEDNSSGDCYYSASEEERQPIEVKKKKSVSWDLSEEKITQSSKRDSLRSIESSSSVISSTDTEELINRFPPVPVPDDETIARALQFYEDFGPSSKDDGARGPKTIGSSNDELPVPVPSKQVLCETYPDPLSPVSSTTTLVYPVTERLPKPVSSSTSSVSSGSSRSSSSSWESVRVASVVSSSSIPTVKPVGLQSPRVVSSGASSVCSTASDVVVPALSSKPPSKKEAFVSSDTSPIDPAASSPSQSSRRSTPVPSPKSFKSDAFVPTDSSTSPVDSASSRPSRPTSSPKSPNEQASMCTNSSTASAHVQPAPSSPSRPFKLSTPTNNDIDPPISNPTSTFTIVDENGASATVTSSRRMVNGRPVPMPELRRLVSVDVEQFHTPSPSPIYDAGFPYPWYLPYYGPYWPPAPPPPPPPPFSSHRTSYSLDKIRELPFGIYPDRGFSVYRIEECDNYYYLTFKNVHKERYYRAIPKPPGPYVEYMM